MELYGYPIAELELIGDSYYVFETGEYVGDKLPESFTVNDDSSLEWVMEKIFNAEADEKAESDKIAALLKAYEGRRKKKAARIEWLRARFSAEIEAYAKTKLDGKTKYVDTPFGRIAWRTSKGGLRMVDESAAVALAEAMKWDDAIKVSKKFLISKLDDSQKSMIAEVRTGVFKEGEELGLPERLMKSGFEVEYDSETCTIKTAVSA